MQRPSRYRLPADRKVRAAGFRWLLVLLMLAAIAWVWWQSRQPPPDPKVPAASATNGAAAPQATVLSNPPPLAPQPAPPKPALVVTSAPPIQALRTSAPPVVVVTSAPPPLIVRTNPPVEPPGVFPRRVQNVFEAQVALARQNISPGSIDGLTGSQTRAALGAFQRKEGLPATGDLDAATKERLLLDAPPLTTYFVNSNDLARLQSLRATWLGKSQQSALDYETLLELVAEKSRSHPNLIRRLNPGVDWNAIAAGARVELPDAAPQNRRGKAAYLHIHLASRRLEVFDAQTNLLAHFPCSIAARVEKRPVGELRVAVVVPDPNYTFNPEVFPESAEARQLGRKLVLPPGPNNPVGVAWIGLDLPGYGIHGTPSPEQVGRTESHGCFRLANWNVEQLSKLVWVGLPVIVEP